MNGIELAIGMEMDSKRFYLEQAEKANDSGLKSIFHTLAEEESIHARILKSRAETLPYELIDTHAEIKNIFVEIGAYKNIIDHIPDAFNIYTRALENEKKSINMYRDILKELSDEKDKTIVEFILEQENDHCKVMEQLVELVKPE